MSDLKLVGPRRFSSGTGVAFSQTGATDIFLLVSGVNNVRVRKVILAGSATSPTRAGVFLVKRAADNTGGTRTAFPLIAPYDTAQKPTTATLFSYSANPSALATLVGQVGAYIIGLSLGAAVAIDHLEMNFETVPIVLRAGESLALNLGTANPTAGTAYNATFVWDED